MEPSLARQFRYRFYCPMKSKILQHQVNLKYKSIENKSIKSGVHIIVLIVYVKLTYQILTILVQQILFCELRIINFSIVNSCGTRYISFFFVRAGTLEFLTFNHFCRSYYFENVSG